MATGTVKWRGEAREVMSPIVAERRQDARPILDSSYERADRVTRMIVETYGAEQDPSRIARVDSRARARTGGRFGVFSLPAIRRQASFRTR
jgi:hypothetical protein